MRRSEQALTFPPRWLNLRIFTAAAVLLLSAAVGTQGSPKILAGIIALTGAAAAYVFLARHMALGILAVVPVTFLVPFTLGTGTNVPLNTTILWLGVLLAVWLIKMLVVEKNIRLAASPVNLPAVVFLISTTVSLLIGNLPLVNRGYPSSLPAQLGGWLLYAFSAGGMLLVGSHLTSARWLKWFLWLFFALGSVYLAFAWRYGVEGANWRFFQEGISGAVFWTMLAAIGAGQAVCNRQLSMRWRLLAAAVTLASLAFGWIRGKGWLAGWLPPLFAVFLVFWLHDWKLGLVLTVAAGLALLPFAGQLIAEINTDDQQWSTYSRFLTWSIMLDLVKVNPVFGLGMSNYFQYTHLYPLYGYYVSFNSHNNYWDIAAQTGLLGLSAFLWMAAAILRLGLRVLRAARDSFTRSYAVTALAVFTASLAAGMMADWFMPFLYNIGFAGFRTSVMLWFMLGGLISLNALQQNQAAQPAEPAQ